MRKVLKSTLVLRAEFRHRVDSQEVKVYDSVDFIYWHLAPIMSPLRLNMWEALR